MRVTLEDDRDDGLMTFNEVFLPPPVYNSIVPSKREIDVRPYTSGVLGFGTLGQRVYLVRVITKSF